MSFKETAKIMSVVTQHPQWDQMKVEEYILLGRIPHFKRFQFMETPTDLKAADNSMDLTHIHHLRDKSMSQISGGEQKLVSIARALCQEPRLLVLDEPTSFLDISNQMAIMDLLQDMNQNLGLSVIAVLHDLNLASEYCDRVMMLNGGKIHKIGKPHDVFTYQIIEDIYKTVVVVKENPITKRPYVFPIPKKSYTKNKK
jgi:iron complex transport system ATP-binding protein